MKQYICLLSLCVFCFACRQETTQPVQEVYSSATYVVTVTGKWNSTDFGVPAGVHFTRLAGAVHGKEISFWKEGGFASKNIEAIAENGNANPLWAEVDSLIAINKALTKISANTPPPTGSSVFTITADTRFPLISFASMLAPTPDWFFGVSGFALYRNSAWINDTTIQLYSFDGGTEQGDIFSYNNPETLPQQPIRSLTANTASVLFKGAMLPIAEMRIQKQ